MSRLRVGQVLYGFCQGHFGRDSYGDKRVEAIGADWVVVREETTPLLYRGDPEFLLTFITPQCLGCGLQPLDLVVCPRCGT